jgi:hypothetical protein
MIIVNTPKKKLAIDLDFNSKECNNIYEKFTDFSHSRFFYDKEDEINNRRKSTIDYYRIKFLRPLWNDAQ